MAILVSEAHLASNDTSGASVLPPQEAQADICCLQLAFALQCIMTKSETNHVASNDTLELGAGSPPPQEAQAKHSRSNDQQIAATQLNKMPWHGQQITNLQNTQQELINLI